MYLNEFRMPLRKGSKATLFIFGDIQMHSKGYHDEIFQEFKNDFLNTPNAWAIGLGDYGDFLRPSLRTRLSEAMASDPDSRAQLDGIVNDDVDKMSEKLMFLKNRLVGLHSGHHEWEYKNGTNSSQKLCDKLNASYLGWTAYSVVRISPPAEKGKKAGTTISIKIFSTHGDGGSGFNSSDLTNLERKIAPYWVSDLYLRGHSHKGEMCPMELNDVTLKGAPRLIKRTRWVLNCPSMLGGYYLNDTGYAEYRALPPAAMGYAKCEIQFSSSFHDIAADGKAISGIKLQPMIVSPHSFGQDHERKKR
jgi:hypothetical protein